MSTWFTSDLHLGADKFTTMHRPFKYPDEMIDTLVANYNNFVNDDDVVYFIGDIVDRNAEKDNLQHMARFKGKKILLRGNHDRGINDQEFSKYFIKIYPEGEHVDIDVLGIPCSLNHYPSRGKTNRFNIVGHIHGAFRVQPNMLNIGVDVHHYRPINFERVYYFYDSIKNFYDEDTWVAYEKFNTDHINTKCKPSAVNEVLNKFIMK